MILVNGVETDYIRADDRGLLYGDGIFETIAVKNSVPLLLSSHLNRLSTSATKLSIRGIDIKAICDDVEQIISKTGLTEAILRITLTRGSSIRGYASLSDESNIIISIVQFPTSVFEKRASGVDVIISDQRLYKNPNLAGIKHLNRLDQVLIANEAAKVNVDEAVVLSEYGFVVEGGKSNLFAVINDVIVTPVIADYGVAGIMRQQVMKSAKAAGYAVEERGINVEELKRARELFLTNSIIGIWPVRNLDGISIYQREYADSILELVKEDIV